ncbi:alpha/beta hydrolase [Nitrogeniibacter mangrovi]|uniref:Alpha/beta hydrolase n=1 Tax=Nitrogeniibacter mangrovi TaxID=2016596 RepID=A0A6C1AZW9_9RHOO|nr:alpha/beta fold hydrolase [Nitrogeniibacter mangrovi]QID16906.1 alpha/beta hydrolase [Nitrogeniibacter mangrovi]
MKPSTEKRTNGRVQLLTPAQRRWVRLTSSLLPGWSAERAERLLLRPPRMRGRAGEVLDAWGRRVDLQVDGHTVATWRFGEAAQPQVVLVHGWGGYGGQFARWIEPLRARGFGVVLFDMPGHGESGGRAGRVDEFTRAIDAVIDACSGVTAVVAHSMGGAASVQLLRTRRDLAGLVVIAAPASLAHHVRDLSARVGLGPAAHRSLVGRLESAHRPVAELDDLSSLPTQTTRALFIHDRDDAEVDFAHLARFGAQWPGSETLATEGWGHYRVLGAPEVIARAVDFIGATAGLARR